MKKYTLFLSLLFVVALFSYFNLLSAALPFGANLNPLSNQTAPIDPAGSHAAVAGNVSEVNLFGYTTTQSWQGYYGNVSGAIFLADNSDKVFYNWSLASPEGEVYASTNDSILWNNIQCLNFTATGTYDDDSGQRGNTSLYGTNLTQLEGFYDINSSDVDGVNETFTLIGGGTHNLFYTNNLVFEEGECRSTRIFTNESQGEDDKFEEVLLYDPNTQSVVFASLLNEDVFGFDNKSHDFQMLVLENGHNTDNLVTPYYFYVELQ